MFGIIDINAFDPWVTGTALPHAAVNPGQLVILLLYNVLMSVGAPTINNCCILGYHGVLGNGQTYSPMEFDQTGSSVLPSTILRYPHTRSANGWMIHSATTPLRLGEASGRLADVKGTSKMAIH